MLSNSDVTDLARELNHLLWTADAPMPSERHLRSLVATHVGNMQCQAHSLVCAALMLGFGQAVVTRGGSALVVYPEPQGGFSGHLIGKHWWITTPLGVCDLSINLAGLAACNPIVFNNQNVAEPSWRIESKDDFIMVRNAAEKWAYQGYCGIYYHTEAQMTISSDSLEDDLAGTFQPAKAIGIELRYSDLVRHCRSLVARGPSVRQLPQQEAWKALSDRD